MSTDEETRQAAGVLAGMAGEFTDLARLMTQDATEPAQTLSRVVAVAARSVVGGEHAAISVMAGNGPPQTGPTSDDLPLQVDRIQYETGEGPCMQALMASDLVLVNDLASSADWPSFAKRAVDETGVRSMLSFRLFLTDTHRGALNFYASVPGAFADLSISTGAIFASYTSLSLINDLHRDKAANLEYALEHSRAIGTAIGILMARELCTQDEAFERLRVASQHTHRKLRDIAEDVTQTGSLPKP